MPRLLLFIPCEKVILSSEDNTASLITILETLQIHVTSDGESSSKQPVIIPLRWCAVTMWAWNQEDEGKQFEQDVRLFNATGELILNGITPFSKVQENPKHRIINNLTGFPLREPGEYSLALFLREVGNSKWIKKADYQIIVSYVKVETTEAISNVPMEPRK